MPADDPDDPSTGADGGVTLSDLLTKLHVPIPFKDAYLFNGAKGTFVMNTGYRPPEERILEGTDEEDDAG